MAKNRSALIGIIMGSDSDYPVLQEAGALLEEFGVPFEVQIVSAHRTPDYMARYAKQAHRKGLRIIIAGAGGAAHLPGMVSAHTALPVIGVPVKTKALEGLDSLLSIVQMPNGVPTATVGINMGKNAGLLAVQMLAITDHALFKKLISYKAKIKKESLRKNNAIRKA